MNFRHELKHEINYCDYLMLRQRLGAVMKHDSHCIGGKYEIRSLYFDSLNDIALREKLDGVNSREKFRIRYYNSDTSYIVLEKKSKIGGLCQKQEVRLTEEEADNIAKGKISWMPESGKPLVEELYSKMNSRGLHPKTIVDYTREPYVFSAGNVRVTVDYDIRTGLSCTDFLNPDCITVPISEPVYILEVKWDDFLPDIIRDAVTITGRRAGAFSKYAACRTYD